MDKVRISHQYKKNYEGQRSKTHLWFCYVNKNPHHELLHTDRESGRIQKNLTVFGQKADDVLNKHHKVLRKQLISL